MAAIAAACAVVATGAPAAALETTIAQQVAVPSYIHPNASPADWGRLATSAPGSVGIAVANVINGPDYTPLPEWAGVIHATHQNGVPVAGYVDTGYLGTTGQRTRLGSSNVLDWMSQIQRDVDAWYAFYGNDLAGIFFDQGQNACGPNAGSNGWADLYRDLNDYVKRQHPGAITVLNPGIVVPQCYEFAADVLVTFEGSYDGYVNAYTPLSWDPVDPKKIWHIVYGASTTDQMAEVMALSKTRSAGYVYVTDDVLANPYDRLPPEDYWTVQQALAVQLPPIPLVPPPPPPALYSVDYTGTTISMDWLPSVGVTAPVVAYDIYQDGVRVGSVPATANTFVATNLTPQTIYQFAVVARDALGQASPASLPMIEHTDPTYGDPPRQPRMISASNTTYTSTVLRWDLQKELRRKPPVVSFIVQQNGRPILRLPGSARAVTVGKLAPGAAYAFSLIAVDETGDVSKPSASVSVATPPLPTGGTISNVAIVEGPDALTLSADFLVPFAFRRVFIASNDPTRPCWSTGSEPQLCADFVIENERLLQYAGSGTDWQWNVVRDVEPVITGTTYAWTVAPGEIGTPAPEAVAFNANGYAPNSYCGPAVACASYGPPLPYE
jgi:chitodextrinase